MTDIPIPADGPASSTYQPEKEYLPRNACGLARHDGYPNPEYISAPANIHCGSAGICRNKKIRHAQIRCRYSPPSRQQISGPDGGPVRQITSGMTAQEAVEAYQAMLRTEQPVMIEDQRGE
jgi:hypothetical protein